MAGGRLWTLSSAERSILIIYSSALPHSWLGETPASSGPKIPDCHSHQPGPQRPRSEIVSSPAGESWSQQILEIHSHSPAGGTVQLTHHASASCSSWFQSSSGRGSDPAKASQEPWFSVTWGQHLHLLPPKAVGRIKWGNMWQHLTEHIMHLLLAK